MHGWIRHPLKAVTTLASVGQDPALGPWGPSGVSAFPRCRDLAGSSPPALACGGGCFPFPSRSVLPECPESPGCLCHLSPFQLSRPPLGRSVPVHMCGWVAAKIAD